MQRPFTQTAVWRLIIYSIKFFHQIAKKTEEIDQNFWGIMVGYFGSPHQKTGILKNIIVQLPN